MDRKKRILLKITGKSFLSSDGKTFSSNEINKIISQIKKLNKVYQFGIVVGGGNILRGEEQGDKLGLTKSIGHQAGMLATMINSLIIMDLFYQQNVPVSLLSAIVCPQISKTVSPYNIDIALQEGKNIIFAGGTGNPFFTTDTTAVLRGLQIEATQIWKGTGVDGVYTSDPKLDPKATLIKKTTYKEAIAKKLRIMDETAFALAEKHKQTIRVFNIFTTNALIKASENTDFGSTIT